MSASNISAGGEKMSDILLEGAVADALYNPAKPNLLLLWAGTNDIVAPKAPALVVADMKTYCLARRAAGFKIAVLTMLPRFPLQPGIETNRLAFNALIRADTSFYDVLMDVGGDSVIGQDQQELNRTYYSSDQLHLITAGYAKVADYAQIAIDAMLALYP